MQKKTTIVPLILGIMLAALSIYAVFGFRSISNASSLNSDQQKIYNFLIQVNPETGYSNAEVLGITDLETPSEWVSNFVFNGSQQLTRVSISDNTKVYGALDLSGCTSLTSVSCQRNHISELKLSGCTSLTTLFCGGNRISELDLKDNTLLSIVWCFDNLLNELDVTNNTVLRYLSCSGNFLTKLDVTKNTMLTSFDCFNNILTELDISKNTSLNSIWCNENQLTELDVTQNNELKTLWCHENRLAEINVENNTELESLSCSQNQLAELDVSGCTLLTSLWCDENNLVELDVTNNTLLEHLSCSNNQIAELDLTGCTALTILYLPSNRLTELNVTNNSLLKSLYCSNNQIQELDLTSCTLLEWVVIYNNHPNLDVSNVIDKKFVSLVYSDPFDGLVYSRSWQEHLGVDYWLSAKCIGVPSNVTYLESQLYLDNALDRFVAYIGFEFENGFGIKEWHDVDGLANIDYAEYISNNNIWGEINADVELETNGIEKTVSITLVFDFIDYKINYNDLQGADNNNAETYTYGTGLILQNPGTRDGYDFIGWFDSEDGGSQITEIGDREIGDKILWARWQPIDEAPGIVVIYKGLPDKISNPNPNCFDKGSEVFLQKPSKRKGYKFVGWFDSEVGGNNVAIISASDEGEITLWARWEVQQTNPVPDWWVWGLIGFAVLLVSTAVANFLLQGKLFGRNSTQKTVKKRT